MLFRTLRLRTCKMVKLRLYGSWSLNFRFLQSTVGGLHATQPPTIRISAIRAVYSYCQHLKSANTTQYLIPFLPNILDGLLSIATQFSSDVLSLCLETLSILLTVSWSRLSIAISVIVKTIFFLFLSLHLMPNFSFHLWCQKLPLSFLF